jgi:hypothetical protein
VAKRHPKFTDRLPPEAGLEELTLRIACPDCGRELHRLDLYDAPGLRRQVALFTRRGWVRRPEADLAGVKIPATTATGTRALAWEGGGTPIRIECECGVDVTLDRDEKAPHGVRATTRHSRPVVDRVDLDERGRVVRVHFRGGTLQAELVEVAGPRGPIPLEVDMEGRADGARPALTADGMVVLKLRASGEWRELVVRAEPAGPGAQEAEVAGDV